MRWPLLSLTVSLALISFAGARAAEPAKPTSAPPSPVVKNVGAESITRRELEREVKRALAGRKAEAEAMKTLEDQVLAHLVNQRLVLLYLARHDLAASAADVNLEIERLKKQLAQQKVTLTAHLAALDLTEPELRQTFRWQLSWRRYLKEHVTDDSLQKYFAAHARDFDGTQMKVAHILLKLPEKADAKGQAETIAKATDIRREITAGKFTFAAAAAQHSAAPTAAAGGDIGFISRGEPMPEAFSAAAFSLSMGQVSEPVVTAAGVHLITVLEIKPGIKTWSDVREPLTAAVTQYLFEWCADSERKRLAE